MSSAQAADCVVAVIDRPIELLGIEAAIPAVTRRVEDQQRLANLIESFRYGSGKSMSIPRGAKTIDRAGCDRRRYQGALPPHNPLAQRDLPL